MTNATMHAAHGIILFAHGARDPAWALPFEAIAALIREKCPTARVEIAFLELMPPDLGSTVSGMVRSGVTTIDVVPVFMAAGSHLKRDLPLLVEAARTSHPVLTIRLHAAIGEHPHVQQAIAAACLGAAAEPATT